MSNVITLERFSYAEDGTLGVLTVGDLELFTVERPWLANKPRVSCIPEGIYDLEMRFSPVVKRSSGGKYQRGWEVKNVQDRTYIMLHPGNTMDDLAGCIAPGLSVGRLKGKPAVLSSRDAFDKLMDALSHRSDWQLHIYQRTANYP